MFSILVKILQTDKGKALVKKHDSDRDAQAILAELHQFQTSSELASNEITRLITYLTNLRLNDSWKGTTQQFLYHFNEKLWLLNSLVPSSERLPDSCRLSFLKITIAQIPDLRCAHIVDGIMKTWSGTKTSMTYEEYYDLLHDAAFHLDQSTKQSSRNCHVQIHEVDPFTDKVNFDEPEDSSPPLSYEIYMTSFKTGPQATPVKIFIPHVLWEKFTEADKKLIIDNKKIPKKPASATHGQKLASPFSLQTHDHSAPG